MSSFKELSANDIKTAKSFLNQLVDVIQEDVSSSISRKRYQVFVTGGVGPGVTSSLFQTVFDQDFSFQTSNPIFDMTVGLFEGGTTVTDIVQATDSAGKKLFPSTSMMMREKIQIYKQFAQLLSGNADAAFTVANSDGTVRNIDEALFISFKRLFTRDQIKRETVAMKMYRSASSADSSPFNANTRVTSTNGASYFTDVGSTSDRLQTTVGYQYGNLVNSADTTESVGLVFYEPGVVVLDIRQAISSSQYVTGAIRAMNSVSPDGFWSAGYTLIGSKTKGGNPGAKFVPDFVTSASIDDIVDHFASCRFGSGSETAITFQNVTQINSTLIFCRASADEFNYSSNPTYIEDDGTNKNRIVVIDDGSESTQKSFTFITTVGLYDANDNLLAVAKVSRPVEKNDEKDLTFRVRLDF